MAPPRSKLFTKFKNHFALTGAQILRVSDLLLGTVGILNTAGVAEQGVHRVHVHPQFVWRRNQPIPWKFPFNWPWYYRAPPVFHTLRHPWSLYKSEIRTVVNQNIDAFKMNRVYFELFKKKYRAFFEFHSTLSFFKREIYLRICFEIFFKMYISLLL